MSSLGARLQQILGERGFSPYKLYKNTGVSQSTISRILKGENVPNKSTLSIIADYLEVNAEWLLTGEGETYYRTNAAAIAVSEPMEQIANKNGNIFEEQKSGNYKIFVKKVPVKAFGSYLTDFQEADFYNDLEQVSFTVDHVGRGNYICFEVQGDSMNGGGIYDAPEGAELLCRELGRQHWKDGFRDSVYGWVIVHRDTVLYKDIRDFNHETGDIVCHSRSGLPQHGDFTISLNDVRQIWKVIKRSF